METRPITPDEIPAFYSMFMRAMGFQQMSEAHLEHQRKHFRPERSLATFDGSQIVGTTHSHLFDLTLPGGSPVPAAGVTAVGVAATHRRRGIVRELMRRQLGEAAERGEPVAILIASESVIYGRFGFGLSASLMDVEIDPRFGQFLGEPPPGRVVFVDESTADKVFPEIHDAFRRRQPGAINRPESWWESWRNERKPGADSLLVYENDSGEAAGYARYNVKAEWASGLPKHSLNVQELVPLTPEASRAMWRHCLDVDLVRAVKAGARPVDEPLRWFLANPRAMQVGRFGDFLWTRVLDVPRVLSERTYATDGELVLQVNDGFLPDCGGRFALSVSNGEASCERSSKEPDLEMAAETLGSIVLGGTSPWDLARAGRIIEHTPGSLGRAVQAFPVHPAPWGCTWF